MSGVISGACIVSKLSGMVYIREDDTPQVIEWTAIDQLKKVTIPLNKLTNLQASKETTPKLMLKLFYKALDAASNEEKDKDIKLTFSNRPTMNNIKDALQTILARLRTTIKDAPPPSNGGTPIPTAAGKTSTPLGNDSKSTSLDAAGEQSSMGTPASKPSPSPSIAISDLDFSNPKSLSDESLLKNHALQQKLLFEDKGLRDKFTQAVINFKLSPSVFWQTRLNQLRTYALTTSQHRGAYNVLSTIKPVATSDNQVNVNVTRDTINEIFETYPIIKKLFDDLVPLKFPEGEFWSRFFNSKLFRRLRGDRINNSNQRSDVILDKYLYVDENFIEEEQKKRKREAEEQKNGKDVVVVDSIEADSNKKQKIDDPAVHVNKFIDLVGNEEDNSQKLGNKPDITMRFGDSNISNLLNSKNKREIGHSSVGAGVENEMLVIMRNMNRLSEKIVATTEQQKENAKQTGNKDEEGETNLENDNITNEYAAELDLNDLHEPRQVQFIELNINTNTKDAGYSNIIQDEGGARVEKVPVSILKPFLRVNKFTSSPIDLTDTFATKKAEIEKTSVEINSLIKQNFRSFRMSNNYLSNSNKPTSSIIPPNIIQEIVTIHITSMELLSHFWRGFTSGDPSQTVQTRKIVISLKKCLAQLDQIESQCVELINQYTTEEKTREKLAKEVKECMECGRNGLNRATKEYGQALIASEKQ